MYFLVKINFYNSLDGDLQQVGSILQDVRVATEDEVGADVAQLVNACYVIDHFDYEILESRAE
jgi:hypothetical protein